MNDNERRVLDAIKDYVTTNGISPTVRELGAILGYQSSSTTQRYIDRLTKLGHLRRIQHGSVRGYVLASPEDALIDAARRSIKAILDRGSFRIKAGKNGIVIEDSVTGDKIPL